MTMEHKLDTRTLPSEGSPGSVNIHWTDVNGHCKGVNARCTGVYVL